MMAYTYPLSLAQFFDILPISEIIFDIPDAVQMDETEGGELIIAELGTRLWQGEVRLGDMTANEAAEVGAMLDVLRGAGASFMAYDVARPGPRLDVTGAGLGASTPTMTQVTSDNREIRLSGLPSGYQLKRYDYVGFQYGSNPTRFALHRLASNGTAVAEGVTQLIQVTPPLSPGWIEGVAVSLVKASCKARLVPGSVQPGRRRATMTVGAGFKFVQTMRY